MLDALYEGLDCLLHNMDATCHMQCTSRVSGFEHYEMQWNLSIRDTLNWGHLSNEVTVVCVCVRQWPHCCLFDVLCRECILCLQFCL